MQNKVEKISKIASIVIFFAIIILFSLVSLFSKKKDFSQEENRPLATPPKFNVENVLDRSFMSGFESYVSDHFPYRSEWITAKSNIERAIGKREINDVYLLNNKFIGKFNEPDQAVVDSSIKAITQFSQRVDAPVYFMLVPTASGIYFNDLPDYAPNADQKAFIDRTYDSLQSNSDNITALDAYNALYPTRDEYIYYRTDHHWTSLGAYNTYASTIRKMGFAPVLYDNFNIEHANNEFLGTLYSKVLINSVKSDMINFYHNPNGPKVTSVVVNNGIKKTTHSSLYFTEFLGQKDKYSAFLGQNQPEITIKTDMEKGKKLLVLKDSYAHSIAPFLAQHYKEITMLDLRYTMTGIDEIVDLEEYDQVLFLYNADTFSTDQNIKKLLLVK